MQAAPHDWPRRIAILGVGLLGGSVGLSLRRRFPQIEIIGTSRSADRRQQAVDCGAVNRAVESVQQACQDADVVVVASPVDRIASMVISASAVTPPECLITDVGSTKANIVEAVASVPEAAKKFVAAHPIAGSEKTGVGSARADLFDDKVIILTPDSTTDSVLVENAERFWTSTGGRTIRMPPQDHDAHLASVSHVPHLVSALVARETTPESRELVGSGWRDITRVAAGDPQMWTAICQQNRPAISAALGRLAQSVDQLQTIIDTNSDEELLRWLSEAKRAKQETQS